MSQLPYARVIEIVDDCSERMKRSGESHRMFAKWVSEGINAALSATQPSPNPVAAGGYVLVPVEPTPEMLEAASRKRDWLNRPTIKAVYRAMLSARPPIGETVPGAGWQPIETSPKDGTEIILTEDQNVYAGRYVRDVKRNYWQEEGWYGLEDDVLTSRSAQPTHWQPLPPPPLALTQEGETP